MRAVCASILTWVHKILTASFDVAGFKGKLRLLAILALLSYLFNWNLVFQRVNDQVLSSDAVSDEGVSWISSKIEHPFSPLDLKSDVSGHIEKLSFRFVPFLIAHLFHFGHHGLVNLQIFLGLVFPLLVWKTLFNATKSMPLSTTGTLLISALYSGFSFLHDDIFFDSFAYFFLLLSMFFRSRWLTLLFVLCAAFTDERGLLAGALVFIWQTYRSGDWTLEGARKSLGWFICFIVIYAFLRAMIGRLTGLETGSRGLGLEVLKLNLPNIILLVWSVFEGGWLLIFYAAFLALRDGDAPHRYLLAALAASFLLVFIPGLLVGDVIRSHQYAFPLLLIAIVVIGNRMKTIPGGIQKVSIALTLISPITIYLGMDYCGTGVVYNLSQLTPGYLSIATRLLIAARSLLTSLGSY